MICVSRDGVRCPLRVRCVQPPPQVMRYSPAVAGQWRTGRTSRPKCEFWDGPDTHLVSDHPTDSIPRSVKYNRSWEEVRRSVGGPSSRRMIGNAVRKRTRKSESEWRRLVVRLESSRLDALSLCEKELTSLSSLQRWRRRLGEVESGAFVEVPVPAASSKHRPAWSLDVELPDGIVLRFRS